MVEIPSVMAIETVCPSGTPEVVPEMETELSSVALRNPSPPSLIATEIVGAGVGPGPGGSGSSLLPVI